MLHVRLFNRVCKLCLNFFTEGHETFPLMLISKNRYWCHWCKWAVVYWYSLVQFLIMADLLIPWRFSVFDGWKLLLTNHCVSQAKILIPIKQILELEFVSSFAKGWWFTLGSVFRHHSSADHFNKSDIFIKYSRLQPKTPFLLHSFLPGNCNFSLVTW